MKQSAKKVSTKTRWESGAENERLAAAIYDWDNKSGPDLDGNGNLTLNWRQVATINKIPMMTFYHYIHSDLTKRRLLGGTSGRQHIMDIDDKNLVGKKLARTNRANTVMDPRDVRAFVRYIEPSIRKE